MRTCLALAFAVPALALASCRQPYVQPQLGYIPRAVPLTEAPGDDEARQWIDPAARASEYGKIVVLPVTTVTTGTYAVSDDDQKQICGMFEGRLDKDFSSWQGTGPKTLYVHAVITALRANDPARNVRPLEENRVDRGFAACEVFCTDGENGPVVAAYMETTYLGRSRTKRLTELGTAEGAVDKWSAGLKDLLKTAKRPD